MKVYLVGYRRTTANVDNSDLEERGYMPFATRVEAMEHFTTLQRQDQNFIDDSHYVQLLPTLHEVELEPTQQGIIELLKQIDDSSVE